MVFTTPTVCVASNLNPMYSSRKAYIRELREYVSPRCFVGIKETQTIFQLLAVMPDIPSALSERASLNPGSQALQLSTFDLGHTLPNSYIYDISTLSEICKRDTQIGKNEQSGICVRC